MGEDQGSNYSSSGFSFDKVTEFLGSLSAVYAGVKVAESEADKLKYTAQLQAQQEQLNYPQYASQSLPENGYYTSAGPSGNNPILWVGLGLVAVFLLTRQG